MPLWSLFDMAFDLKLTVSGGSKTSEAKAQDQSSRLQ